MKHFHPEKSTLAKHALELEHRMNWSKTQMLYLRIILEKYVSLNRFSLIPHRMSLAKKVQIFPQTYKATFGYN